MQYFKNTHYDCKQCSFILKMEINILKVKTLVKSTYMLKLFCFMLRNENNKEYILMYFMMRSDFIIL